MSITKGIPIDIIDWQGIDEANPRYPNTVTVRWREVIAIANETITYYVYYGTTPSPWNENRRIEIGRSETQITGLIPGIPYYFNVRCEKPSVNHPNELNSNVRMCVINAASSTEWTGIKEVVAYRISEETSVAMYERNKTDDMGHLVIESLAFRIKWEPIQAGPGEDILYYVTYSSTNPPGEDAQIIKVYNKLYCETPYLQSGRDYYFNVKGMVIPSRVAAHVVINDNNNVIGITRQV